jgi:hypothetical protein
MAKATDTKTGHGSFFLGEFNQDFSIGSWGENAEGSWGENVRNGQAQ